MTWHTSLQITNHLNPRKTWVPTPWDWGKSPRGAGTTGKTALGVRGVGSNALGSRRGAEENNLEVQGAMSWGAGGEQGKTTLEISGLESSLLRGRGQGEKRLGVQGRGDERLCLYAMSSNAPGLPNPKGWRGVCRPWQTA